MSQYRQFVTKIRVMDRVSDRVRVKIRVLSTYSTERHAKTILNHDRGCFGISV